MRAIVSRIRENTRPRIFLLEAATVLYSFTASAFRSDWPSLRDDPAGLLRLAIPAAIVLIVLLLRDAYTVPEQRNQLAPAIDVIIAFALALVSQMVLAAVAPELVLPRWAPTQGTFVGWMFLAGLRAFFPPGPDTPTHTVPGSPLFLEEVQYKAHEFEKDIRRRNRIAYIVGAAVFTGFAVDFLVTNNPRVRVGSALIIAGALYVLFEIRRRGLPERVPREGSLVEYDAVYRTELQRQCALLHRVWYWYFGSLLPGCLLPLLGSFVYPYVWLLCIFLFAAFHLRAAERLRRNVDELN
jgi:hypothetical protein